MFLHYCSRIFLQAECHSCRRTTIDGKRKNNENKSLFNLFSNKQHFSTETSHTSYFTYSRRRFGNVSGGNGFCLRRNCNFSKPSVGFCSMFISAWLWSVTGSSSCSERGGMSVNATHAESSANITSHHLLLKRHGRCIKTHAVSISSIKKIKV